eukprot:3451384-Amphidinium_carterae.1
MFVAVYVQTPVSVRQAVQSTFSSVARWRVFVLCVLVRMSEGRGCSLSEMEATILRESGSFWPGSMLDKDTFMQLLANILSLEFQYQIMEWEKQLVATGALGDAGMVDVQLFVAASSVSPTLSDPRTIVMHEVGPQSLAPTSDAESQTAVSQADAGEVSTTMSDATITSGDVPRPLPAPEVTVGVVVSIASKRYEITEKLGFGAGGSVHRASPRREATDIGGRPSQGGGPDSVALKLAGGGGGGGGAVVGFRPKDTKLAAMAVEAVAAAEVRRMAEYEGKRWEGRIFLPVLYAVGK